MITIVSKNIAASYCCESSNVVDINSIEKEIANSDLQERTNGNIAASYCCESSNVVDIDDVESSVILN